MKTSNGFGQIGKDTLVNIVGTTLVGFVGLVFYILVARFLGPSQFGIFSVAVSLLVVVSDIFDLGTNTGIVKFVSEAIGQKDFEKAKKIAAIAFSLKLTIGLFILVIGILAAKPLAVYIFGVPALTPNLALAFLGVLIILVLGFFTSLFQAYKKFIQAVFINLTSNLLRLLFIAILAAYGKITTEIVMLSFVLSPLVGVLIGYFKSPLNFFQSEFDKDLIYRFVGFNKWIAVGFILAAIQVRLPNFLLIRLSDSNQTGLFSAASLILLFAPQIAAAISITFAPRFSEVKDLSQLKIFLKKIIFLSLIFASFSLILVPFAASVLNLTVGSEFEKARTTFQILAIASFFIISSVPQITTIIYYWSNPRFFAVLSIVQFIIVFVLNMILIPNFGAVGSAVAALSSAVLGFLLSSFYLLARWQTK